MVCRHWVFITMRIISTIIGSFVIDHNRVVDKILFKQPTAYQQRENYEQQLKKKHPTAQVSAQPLPKLPEYFELLYQANTELTQLAIKDSLKKDHLLINSVHIIEECERVTNILSKRLRDMVQLYLPALEHAIEDNQKLVEQLLQHSPTELRNLFPSLMNGEISQYDWNVVVQFVRNISSLYELRQNIVTYLEKTVQDYAPNLLQVAGAFIGAKLIERAGGLKKLAEMRSTTIQLLGAEKAMFRHMTTKARCPKHGIIINHPLVSRAKAAQRGRMARHLAAAISKAARVDYFKGDQYLGYQLKEELEKLPT